MIRNDSTVDDDSQPFFGNAPRGHAMHNSLLDTFGPRGPVSCGKLRTTRIAWFCGLCLISGLCSWCPLQAQGPEAEGDDGGRRGMRERGGGDRGGGRGGFDPSQMISRLDQDQNGVITENEIENAPGFARRMLEGQNLDFKQGVRVADLQQTAEQRIGEMRRQRDSERSDRPERPDELQPQSMSRSDNQAPTVSPTTGRATVSPTARTGAAQTPRTRISPFLPSAFQTYDTDLDGQVTLSEWRKGKRGPISQFKQYDLDGDGFLIAKELAKANVVAVAAPVPTPGTAAPATTATGAITPVATPAVPSAPLAPVAVSAENALKASRSFDLLDKDKNGTIAGAEWDASRRLKPAFLKSGYDLNKPLTKEEFIQGYVRAEGGK